MHADLSLVAKQDIWHGFVWGGDVTAQSCMQEATMMRTGSGVFSQGEDSSQGQTGILHHATSSHTAVQLCSSLYHTVHGALRYQAPAGGIECVHCCPCHFCVLCLQRMQTAKREMLCAWQYHHRHLISAHIKRSTDSIRLTHSQ